MIAAAAAALLVGVLGAPGCDDDEGREYESSVEQESEEAAGAIKEAGREAGDAIGAVGERAGEAMERGQERAGEALEELGENLQRDADPTTRPAKKPEF